MDGDDNQWWWLWATKAKTPYKRQKHNNNNNNNNNNNGPTPRPRALLPSWFPLELRWNAYFHSLQAVFSSLLCMQPSYCKNHHILMIGSCFFVQYLHFFYKKSAKCKNVWVFWKNSLRVCFPMQLQHHIFMDHQIPMWFTTKKLTFQTFLILEVFAPDFFGLEFFI